MSYPALSRADARAFLIARREDPGTAQVPAHRFIESGPDEDWDAIGSEVSNALLAIVRSGDEAKGEVTGSRFEMAAGPEVHRRLPRHEALGDPEFWTWLAVTQCLEIVEWRYSGKPDLRNYGVGGAGENFLYRLWLRAEIVYAPRSEDPYALSRLGDIDFWRSHIFRQGYADLRAFARALVDFQFPPANGRKPRLKTAEIRELVKSLKRARSNLMFEVMDEVRAGKFVEREWAKLAAPV